MTNPYSPHDPRFGLAPNPLYYIWEFRMMGKQYRQTKKQFHKDFSHLKSIIEEISKVAIEKAKKKN